MEGLKIPVAVKMNSAVKSEPVIESTNQVVFQTTYGVVVIGVRQFVIYEGLSIGNECKVRTLLAYVSFQVRIANETTSSLR